MPALASRALILVLALQLLRLMVQARGPGVRRRLLTMNLRGPWVGGVSRFLLGLPLAHQRVLLALVGVGCAFAFAGSLTIGAFLSIRGELPFRTTNLPTDRVKTVTASSTRVRLLEVDPDLGSALTPEEFAQVRQLAVPAVTIPRYERNLEQLAHGDTFGALVLSGMVLRQLRVADQNGMRLLGPGDIVSLLDSPAPMLVLESSLEATVGTRLALLGREVLLAASRWPALMAGLELRRAQQADRLAAQLVICQLPRVDQRLLALLWLLAESWGRVTPTGTALPMKLTHEALGALIGARRPTVTLALRDLTERGALVRQNEGFLLLERPAAATGEGSESLRPPRLTEAKDPSWTPKGNADAAADADAAAAAAAYSGLKDAVERLRVRHAFNRNHFDESLREYSTARERCRANRMRIERERITRRRRRSPSS